MQTARIEKHPYDESVFLLRPPPSFAREMGRAEFARWSREQNAYVIHKEHEDALRQFASHTDLHLVDDRGRNSGVRTRPHECRHCSQPGSMMNPPRRCPSCGEPWDPITPDDIEDNDMRRRTACPGCGYKNLGRFPFCSACGTRMEHPSFLRPEHSTTTTEPVPFNEALRDYARTLDAVRRPVVPPPARPHAPTVYNGRRVETKDLVDGFESATVQPGVSPEDELRARYEQEPPTGVNDGQGASLPDGVDETPDKSKGRASDERDPAPVGHISYQVEEPPDEDDDRPWYDR